MVAMSKAGSLEMVCAIGIFEREGFKGAFEFIRHLRIINTEITHVKLIDADVFWRGQFRLGKRLPAIRFQSDILQIDNLAARAVRRQADGVRVGDQVVLHLSGRMDVDLHIEQIEFVLPIRLARD